MNIMRRAARVIAALISMGRHAEAHGLQTAIAKRKPRGPKYRPAVQIRGGLCTIGSHDAAVRHVLGKRLLPWGRCREWGAYRQKLAELGVRAVGDDVRPGTTRAIKFLKERAS